MGICMGICANVAFHLAKSTLHIGMSPAGQKFANLDFCNDIETTRVQLRATMAQTSCLAVMPLDDCEACQYDFARKHKSCCE